LGHIAACQGQSGTGKRDRTREAAKCLVVHDDYLRRWGVHSRTPVGGRVQPLFEVPSAQLTLLVPAKHMGFMEHHTQFAVLVNVFAEACFHAAPVAEAI